MLLQDIIIDARFHVSPECTSAIYPDNQVISNANLWYQKVLSWIIPNQGEWEINGDILTIDTVIGQTDYEIPVTFLRIYKAETMYRTGGQYVPLTQLSIQRYQEIAEGNVTRPQDSVLAPTITVFGDFIQIRPAPTEAVVNGLKMWAQLAFEDMDLTDNLPDMPAPVHRILAYGPAFDFCLAKEMWNKANAIKRMIYGDSSVPNDQGLKGEIENMYSTRTGDRRDRMSVRNNRVRGFR